MSTKTLCLLMACTFTLLSSPAMAQEEELPGPEEMEEMTADPVADAARSARESRERGDHEEALRIIELAQVEAPDDGLLIYERVLTLEAMGEEEIALAVIEENRDLMLRHTEVNDLAIVEQRLADATGEKTATGGGSAGAGKAEPGGVTVTDTADPVRSDTPWLGWTAVGVGGVGMTVGTVLLVVANADAVELQCNDCDPGTVDREITREEFEERKSDISTKRVIGGISLGIGAAALAYGIYDILTHEPAVAADESGLSVDVHRRGVGVSYTTTF